MNNHIKLYIVAIAICSVIAAFYFLNNNESTDLEINNEESQQRPSSGYKEQKSEKLSWFKNMLSDTSGSQSQSSVQAPLPPHLNSVKSNPNEVTIVVDESLIMQRELEFDTLIKDYNANLANRDNQKALKKRFKETSADYKQHIIAKVRQLNNNEGEN